MADALVSTPVALTAGAISVALLGIAGTKIKKEHRLDLAPLMGVMGAFIFAAQMVNFSIPGTGSSGHIIGGVLLAALLSPWAAFITLTSVLLIQCLIFADGGLLALGCNIINMGLCTTLIAYPLIYKPLIRYPSASWKIIAISILACVIGLELGACAVTAETELSGITALPAKTFLGFMTSIHLAIGAIEGLATAAVIIYVQKVRPSILMNSSIPNEKNKVSIKNILLTFGIAALVIGGIIAMFASSDPDGLEWSIYKIIGSTEPSQSVNAVSSAAGKIQDTTAVLPDYDNALSGIIGATMVLLIVWAITGLIVKTRGGSKKLTDPSE